MGYIYLTLTGLKDIASWPGIGSYWVLLFIFIFPGIIFQALLAFFYFSKWKIPQRTRYLRIAAVIMGIVLVQIVYDRAGSVAMRTIEETYSPLVEKLNISKDFCNLLSTCVEKEALQGIYSPTALYHKEARFILTFWGRSVDIDGSTIFYDSATKEWRIFHNDDQEKVREMNGITSGMEKCLLR